MLSPTDDSHSLCPMCGKPVSPEAVKCPSCGEALTPATPISATAQEQRRQRRIQKSLAALGLLILALAGIAAFSPPLAIGAALLFGPASVATMIKATAVRRPGEDLDDAQVFAFFWPFLAWTFAIAVGVPLVLGIFLSVLCAVSF
jgi:hypothetical protein